MSLSPAALAGLSGFVALSYEILWFRGFSFASGALPLTFALLLASYLAGLGAGAFLAGRRMRMLRGGGAAGPAIAAPLAPILLAAAGASYLVLPFLGVCATIDAWWLGYLPVAVAAGLMGTVLPIVSHATIEADSRAGSGLSRLYLSNILGSTLGSFLTGFLLLHWLPLATVAWLFAVMAIALAGFAGWWTTQGASLPWYRRAGIAPLLLPVPLLAAGTLHDDFYARCYFKGDYGAPDARFIEVVENRHGVIAVTDDDLVVGGGTFDGVITTDLADQGRNWIVRPYALGVIHDEPRDALLIGLSTGAWAQVIAHLPGVESLTAVEINPGYLRIIETREMVRSLLRNPRVRIEIDDGRRWLRRNPERRFDLIVQNTTHHWKSNASSLLSREYMELVKAHLKPGGRFMVNATGSDAVGKTVLEAFPYGIRLYSCLVASDSPVSFDNGAWREFLASFTVDGRVAGLPADERVRREVLELGLAYGERERLETREQLLERTAGLRTVTDDNMDSEWRPLRWAPTR